VAIDVHSHYVPPHLIEDLEIRAREFNLAVVHGQGCRCAVHFDNGPKLRPFFPELVEPLDARLKAMDRIGIDHAVLSAWADLFAPHFSAAEGAVWHGFLNGHLRRIRDKHPDRFSYLASLPLPHSEAAAQILEEEVTRHGAAGAVIPANVSDVNLGEFDLEAFWRTAAALDVGVFIHPVQAIPQTRSAKFGLTQTVQYTADTTLTAGSIIMSGVLDRHPDLRLLLSHGGGSLPFLIGRFDCMHDRMDKSQQHNTAKEKPSAYLRRFYYDTIVHDPNILAWLVSRVSAARVVLGSDYSFPPADRDPVGSVRAAALQAGEQSLLLEGNAKRLFPTLKRI
jgi:aminocarboxymuconate-semialdehyde decarboxylase